MLADVSKGVLKRTSVLIPYRPSAPERTRSYTWLSQFLSLNLPCAEIVVADSDTEIFNRAAARNKAFSQSTRDLLVFLDADTIPHVQGVLRILNIVDSESWGIGYDKYHALTESSTEHVFRMISPAQPFRLLSLPTEFKMTSHAGVVCMTREVFEELGGYDERFRGWGYEDTAFANVATKLFGPPLRPGRPSVTYHLWHKHDLPDTWDQPDIKHNEALCAEYNKLSTKAKIKEYLANRGSYL